MNTLTDKDIEAAFRKIRANFEQRGNEDGLTMLDSFEEGWAVYGRLTDRQIAWLERQLDGSWRRNEAQDLGDDAKGAELRKPNRHTIESPPSARGGSLSDTMMRRQLRQQREAAVDLDQLEEIEAVIDELKRAVQLLR